MKIRVAGLSHLGRVRDRNDDHYCLGTFVEQGVLTSITIDTHSRFFQEYGLLAAVADGMGAYAGGSLASRVVLETLSAQFYSERRAGYGSVQLAACLAGYLVQTTRTLEAVLKRSSDLADAGTTVAGIALMPPDVLIVFHAGDSRVLRGSAGFVRALTIDHTPLSPDIASGRLSEEQASALPAASQLTRALGLKGDTRVEMNQELAWAPGDCFVIGTDGFHGLGRGLSGYAISTALCAGGDTSTTTERLIADAVKTDGSDNATLILVQLDEGRTGNEY